MLLETFIKTSNPFILAILIIAGLGLFLYGINLMSQSLKKIAGNKLKLIIEKTTNSPIKGILVGMLITILIQSSSGTTALVVGLVSAGLMSLDQAVGVIMGANVGTTITTVLIGLPIANYFMIFVAIGAFIYMLAKSKKVKEIGLALFGFGVLFLGLNLMDGSLNYIFNEYKEGATALFAKFSEIPFLGLLTGTIFTALVQSSAASIGILQSLYSGSIIGLKGALAILIGSNIGTTITAILSSIGSSKNAKRTAVVHAMFNIFGALIFMILLIPYTALLNLIEETFNVDKKLTIAIAHIIFNLLATFILFFFRKPMTILAKKMIRSEEETNPIYQGLSDYSLCKKSAPLALEFSKKAVDYMMNITNEFFILTKEYAFKNTSDTPIKAQEYEHEINLLDKKIHDYLINITQTEVDNVDSNKLSKYLDTEKDLERIGDHLTNICEFFQERYSEKLMLSDEGAKDLKEMFDALSDMLNDSFKSFYEINKDEANKAILIENKIDDMEQIFRKRHIVRLKEGICTVSNLDYYVEILSNLERIGDHADNISNNVINDEYVEFEVLNH
jgi:phosphate:Na+ symporter